MESKKKLISVIISLRNTKKYHREIKRLRDILKSLKAQTIADKIEVIVSDIDSDSFYQKKHEAICKEFGARYIYTNTGMSWNISRARNIGICKASSEYILTTDVDCVFTPRFMEIVLNRLNSNTMVCCRVWELPEGFTGWLNDFNQMKVASTLRPSYGYGTCQAFPKDWAHRVGGFDEEYIMWGAEDKDFYVRAEQDNLATDWIESEVDYFHQWHPQGNRHEDKPQLDINRKRCVLTQGASLDIKRNPIGWGDKITDVDNVAVLVTTFLRDDQLYGCLHSVRRHYPGIAIYVADNGTPNDKKKSFCRANNVIYLALPFDCGVGESRNLALADIPKKYKYIAVIEDDIRFTPRTRLSNWKQLLESDKQIGVVGGLLKHVHGSDVKDQHYEATLKIKDDTLYIKEITAPKWKTFEGLRYFHPDIILNIFMMKREVWNNVRWHSKIKSAPEHSHFFLSLQKHSKWKVAYTDQVELEHYKNEQLSKYSEYRNRKEGYKVFCKEWGVKWCWSSWHPKWALPNPLDLTIYDAKARNETEILKDAVAILNRHQCKWWLEAGTCLGAIREKNFIAYDPDIDIGIAPENLGLWNVLLKEFTESGFKLYKAWKYKEQRIELSFTKNDVKLDLFFFYEDGDNWWHGAFGPNDEGKWGNCMMFYPHVFSKSLFVRLKKIMFKDIPCYVPNLPEDYLVERYGKDWRIPKEDYQYWTDCKAIDRNYLGVETTVFIGGVWDLFHIGHLNILESAKKLGGRLIVGVLTDEAAMAYKPRPTIPFDQRLRIIQAIEVVDETFRQENKDPTRIFQKHEITPDIIVHADDWDHCPGSEFVELFGGKTVYLPYTHSISSTKIKKGIQREKRIKKLKGGKNSTIAIGIKTFLREETLFKTIDVIKDKFPYPYKLYIADDGTISNRKAYLYQQLEKEGHVIIRLSYNSGISVGRNKIVEQVEEEFVLIIDDDIALYDPKAIKNMKKVLDHDPKVGIVSGMLKLENGNYVASKSYNEGMRFDLRGKLLVKTPSLKTRYKAGDVIYLYADQVVNFFLARTEIFNKVKWDNRIKVQYEHLDFFLELKNRTDWKVAACLDAEAVHLKSTFDHTYQQCRRNAPKAYFLHKHNLGGEINQF